VKIVEHEVHILSSFVTIVDTARDLGVIMDRHLTMSAPCVAQHILFPVPATSSRAISALDAAKTVVQALISSRLDYCNSLLYGISDILVRRLQAV